MSEIAGIMAIELASQGLAKSKKTLLKDVSALVVGSAGIAGSAAVKELNNREIKRWSARIKNIKSNKQYMTGISKKQ